MKPQFHHGLAARIKAFIGGEHLNQAPINNKGGRLRKIYSRIAHSPVFGMEIVSGEWYAHTAWGWHPVSWYMQQARRKGWINDEHN